MDQLVKEGFTIFVNAFNRLEDRRKGLSIIENRIQEDMEQCLKRIEEVKSNKKRVPFYSPQYELPIALEEEPVKEVRKRGRKRKEEKAVSQNNADSKISTRRKHRKRASDDDLIDEQPVSKRRGITESKANQQDTPKKVSKGRSSFSEKRTILDIIDNALEEKENNNTCTIGLINSNGTVLNTQTSNHQIMEGEKPLIDMDKNSKLKNSNFFGNSYESNKISENIVQSKTFIKSNQTDKTISDQEKAVTLADSKNNTNLEGERHIIKNIEVTRIEMKSITNVSKPAVSSNITSSSNQMNSIIKKDETIKVHHNGNSKLLKTISLTLKNTIIMSNDDEVKDEGKENMEPVDNKILKKTIGNKTAVANDFAVPLDPSIHTTKAASSQLSSDEGSPVQKRFTRSKSKAIKGKEKICSPSSSEPSSNEDSPVKEQPKQLKLVKGKELPVSSSVESEAFSSDEAPVPLPRITRSKMAKPKDQPKPNLNDCKQTPPHEEEIAPVSNVRMTRSKMAKPKKDKVDAERSSEESDAKSEFNSCSDGEIGKKKVKDIVKMLNEKQAMVLLSPVPITKEQEKENHQVGIMKMLEKKEKITPIMVRKGVIAKTTPLQVRNGYITPNKKPAPVISSATRNKSVMDDFEKRKKEEEARLKRLKEEEVLRKKQEMLKIKQEELKKKHEEKMLKAAAMREAAEKEKTEFILKQEKEREEREKMTKAEIERKKLEEAHKKKMANQTKAAEVESRRLREEAARAAKLKEMEVEQRQHEELRQKQLEENERIMKIRQEDQRAKEVSKQKLYQKEIQKKMKANLIPLKDKDNYSITGDLLADEDSEDLDEENSKKEIPFWARSEERLLPSRIQVHYPMSLVMDFFCCPSSSPDLTDIFGKMTMKRIRSSSAVWLDSPPLKVFQPVNN